MLFLLSQVTQENMKKTMESCVEALWCDEERTRRERAAGAKGGKKGGRKERGKTRSKKWSRKCGVDKKVESRVAGKMAEEGNKERKMGKPEDKKNVGMKMLMNFFS